MGKKHKVKYRIIPESLMKDLVEFIDEMQFEASKTNSTESHHLLNLCMISVIYQTKIMNG